MTDVDHTQRRARLRSVKLLALVRDHLGHDPVDAVPGVFPPGAAAVADGTAWVLLEEEPARGLGPALAWALRQGADRLHLIADRSTGTLSRRAEHVTFPVTVWHLDDRTLLSGLAEPVVAARVPTSEHLALVPTIEAGGAVANVEHGIVTGAVRGLEVCRVVDDPTTGAVRLEVGVGAHDREAFAIIHGDVPTVDALAGVVAAVSAHRSPGAAPHPLQQLAPERLLRWRLQQDPALIGLAALETIEPPVVRPSIKERAACSARGRRKGSAAGSSVLVVCSVGVDLDLVPYAIDARLHEPGVDRSSVGDEVVLVVPERDLVPITAELAALSDQPLSLVAAP